MSITSESPEQIERDIQETRSQIDHKLDELQDRFSPTHLVDAAVDYVKDEGGELASSLGRTVRDNPIPIVLLGAGIAWLAIAGARSAKKSPKGGEKNTRPGTAGAGLPHSGQGGTAFSDWRTGPTANGDGQGLLHKAIEVVGEARNSVSEIGGQVMDNLTSGVSDRAHELTERAKQVTERAKEQGERAMDVAQTFVKENPFVVGAIGLVVGAAIAATLPITRRENEAFGDRSDDLKELAKEKATEQLDKVMNVATSLAADVKTEAERLLSGDPAKRPDQTSS